MGQVSDTPHVGKNGLHLIIHGTVELTGYIGPPDSSNSSRNPTLDRSPLAGG